jgi:polysaccharide export outer membrane protein
MPEMLRRLSLPLLALMLTGCALGSHPRPGIAPDIAPDIALRPSTWEATVVPASHQVEEGASVGPYTLDTGDKLRIFVYGQPSLSRLYTVDQSGRIAFPLIGNLSVRGQSTAALQRMIARKLAVEYVKDPQVTVDIHQNRPFFILGEVRNAGQFPYVSGMTVETAVAIAGGYTERASEQGFRISRRRNDFVEQFEVPPTYLVEPGDTIYVKERFF